jgi:hypothetical protein
VLGVIGPTRMVYEKVAATVDLSSSLLTERLGDSEGPLRRPASSRSGTDAGRRGGPTVV